MLFGEGKSARKKKHLFMGIITVTLGSSPSIHQILCHAPQANLETTLSNFTWVYQNSIFTSL